MSPAKALFIAAAQADDTIVLLENGSSRPIQGTTGTSVSACVCFAVLPVRQYKPVLCWLHIHGISANERPLASLGRLTVVAAAAVAAVPTAPAVGWPARESACPAGGSTRPTPGCSLADLSMDLWSVLQAKSPSGRLELLKDDYAAGICEHVHDPHAT